MVKEMKMTRKNRKNRFDITRYADIFAMLGSLALTTALAATLFHI